MGLSITLQGFIVIQIFLFPSFRNCLIKRGHGKIYMSMGLGEMDAQQLWETTLNPQTRILKQVEIEDGRMASEVTSILMGSDVPPRREFIYEHAREADIDL